MFDNNDPATATFKALVEIQDTQNGGYTSNIKVYASYEDNNGTGNSREETLIKTIASTDFFRADSGLLRSNIEVTLSELKLLLNLTDSQVKTCDVATIRLEAVATDRKSTRLNSSHSTLSRMPSSA